MSGHEFTHAASAEKEQLLAAAGRRGLRLSDNGKHNGYERGTRGIQTALSLASTPTCRALGPQFSTYLRQKCYKQDWMHDFIAWG